MRRQKTEKLRGLLADTPHGYLVDSKLLARYGIDRRLAHKYIKSGWLEPVTRGLYRRPYGVTGGEGVLGTDWKTIVLSLLLMDYDVHVGGMNALSLHGHDHYLSFGAVKNVYLYSDGAPSWLSRISSNVDLILRSRKLFAGSAIGVDEVNTDFRGRTGTAPSPQALMLRASDPERAVLEVLDELPRHESFHTLDMVFESLTSLRPNRLQSLLTDCASIKVKRLFFVFADRHGHAWRKHLSAESFDLGSGARELVKGGKYHPDYHISVPPEYVDAPAIGSDDGP